MNLTSKNGILIIGPQGSGKTTKAMELASSYKKENVHHLDLPIGQRIDFWFAKAGCHEESELLICDPVYNFFDYLPFWIRCVKDGIAVDRGGSDRFYINPKIILLSNSISMEDLEALSESFHENFDIVHLTKEGGKA